MASWPEQYLEGLAAQLGWRTRSEARDLRVCIRCGNPQTVAWAAEDMKEWRISLLCPGCYGSIVEEPDCD